MSSSPSNRAIREADLPEALRIAHAMQLESPTGAVLSLERMATTYLRGRPGMEQRSVVWESGGRIVALSAIFAPVTTETVRTVYLRFLIDPPSRNDELCDEILAWAESSARALFGASIVMEASSSSRVAWKIAMLEQRGYVLDRRFAELTRSLKEPIPAVTIPAGYRIRQFDPEAEVDAWVELYNASFADHYDFHPIPRELRLESVARPNWRPDWDLVVEAADGSLAAFGLAVQNESDDGAVQWHIDLIGTAREHRRIGLARAVTAELMHRLHSIGATSVTLEVDATSPTGADRLYEQLGFVLQQMHADYRKTL